MNLSPIHGLAPTLLIPVLVCACSDEPRGVPAVVAPAQVANSSAPAPPEDELRGREAEIATAVRQRDFGRAELLLEDAARWLKSAHAEDERARGRLLLARGNLEREAAHRDEARRHYADAMALFRVRGDEVGQFEVLIELARLEDQIGDNVAAQRQLDEAQSIAPRIEEPGLQGALAFVTGLLAQRQRRTGDAAKLFGEAVRLFQAAKLQREEAEALFLLATAEDDLERPGACGVALEKAGKIFHALGDLRGEAKTLHRLATLAERQGQLGRARALFEKVLVFYDKLDDRSAAEALRRHLASLADG